mgnify:CR=1 FL=1
MGLFDERIAYKPFEYPEYYTEGWLKQAQAFWLHTEIPMQSDVKDWKEKLNDKEKNLVGNILLGFAQTECAVSDYWTQKVVSWFPKHEIQQMAMMFGSQETIHAVAYSYLNETLGLENFEAFLHEPTTAARFDNLVSYSGTDPIGIAKSLAVFCSHQADDPALCGHGLRIPCPHFFRHLRRQRQFPWPHNRSRF